jgi:hypothetical protein
LVLRGLPFGARRFRYQLARYFYPFGGKPVND